VYVELMSSDSLPPPAADDANLLFIPALPSWSLSPARPPLDLLALDPFTEVVGDLMSFDPGSDELRLEFTDLMLRIPMELDEVQPLLTALEQRPLPFRLGILRLDEIERPFRWRVIDGL